MALNNLLPRTTNITGTNCTGSDGTKDRTYTLTEPGIVSAGMNITINGTNLHEGAGKDYTFANNVLTFLNIVWNDSIIKIDYFSEFGIPTITTSTSLKYATPLMLANILGIVKEIPSWDVEGSPTKEVVGTGDNSVTTFYLDQKSVISDTYTLYHGPDADTLTELTETTHYDLENDTGTLILTTAGVTEVGTDNIYAVYKYYSNGMKDSFVISVLNRAETEVDKRTNSTFTDGGTTNPSYPVITEIQSSPGYFREQIIVENKPLIDIKSSLASDITASDVTISLTNSEGSLFPSTGYIIIGSEVITYSGISGDDLIGCTRGVLNTTAATHSEDDAVHSTILFISNTGEGTAVDWTPQPWDTQMDASKDGLIYSFGQSVFNASVYSDRLTKQDVANRIKIIYLYGYDTIPSDITRLTLILSKRMLIQDNVGASMIKGRNEFNPEMFNADKNEMESIINSYRVNPLGNT